MSDDKKNTSSFPKIPKANKKRRSNKKPPTQGQAGNNIKLKEGTEAVPVKTTMARTFRIGTNISEKHGDLIDELQLKIKKREGKKPSIAEVLERGIDTLNKEFK